MSRTIRILLAEGHETARDALATFLAKESDFVVLPPCVDVTEALAVAGQNAPHVALISASLLDCDSFAASKAVRAISFRTGVIFLTTRVDDEQIARALALKARGILTKQNSLLELPAAIREVAGGGTYFSEEIHARLIIGSEGVRLAKPGR